MKKLLLAIGLALSFASISFAQTSGYSTPRFGGGSRGTPRFIHANISNADQNWVLIGTQTYNTESQGFERPWPFGAESSQQ
jgi:hypothetical protein